MWIKYTDSEVKKYHPLCEKSLLKALINLNLDSSYRVVHHQYAGSLEMDYVIENKTSKKILCVIEVKRTPNDVQSTRFQYQAMSYVQQLYYKLEKPFYIITNLEYSFEFRYDNKLPQPYQQMLSPGLIEIAKFSDFDNESEYIDILSDYFEKCISKVLADNYEYLLTLQDFSSLVEMIKDVPSKWKTNIAVSLYEYIRGSFNSIRRNDLRDVRAFKNDISRICHEGHKVNFSRIFDYDKNKYDKAVIAKGKLLIDLYRFASINITGSMVSDILHSIVSNGNEHFGEVATDKELGKVVSLLAKVVCNDYNENSIICDPAAGSGNLLESAIPVFNLSPTQIFANDINEQYSELLSLRFGLNYPKEISVSNSPRIEVKNITNFYKEDFEEVEIILLNPPYVAGIGSISRKNELVSSMKSKLHRFSIMDVGQAGLELIFLEYVTALVKKGTVVSCIMPKQLLVSRGPEAQKFRNFLISDFGLKIVFNYPGTGLFDSVTKDTIVLVGEIGSNVDEVKFVSSLIEVSDIDSEELYLALREKNLTNNYESIAIGVEALTRDRNELEELAEQGWRFANSELIEAIEYCENNLFNHKKAIQLSSYLDDITNYRGKLGNQGASDLLFFNSSSKYKSFYDKHIQASTNGVPSLRNSNSLDEIVIDNGDSKFIDWDVLNLDITNSIINDFLTIPLAKGKQLKKQKTATDLVKIIKRSAKQFTNENSIVVPRDLRVMGRVFVNTKRIYLSTNFVVLELNDYRKAIIIGSWMSTIFYQLNCEVSSKDNEGTRKMEVADLKSTYIIDPDTITDDQFLQIESVIKTTEFINLQTPAIRALDEVWANILFGEEYSLKLKSARDLLSYVATRRNS